jgi:hypothetical protein
MSRPPIGVMPTVEAGPPAVGVVGGVVAVIRIRAAIAIRVMRYERVFVIPIRRIVVGCNVANRRRGRPLDVSPSLFVALV